jgi:hypothetical protein
MTVVHESAFGRDPCCRTSRATAIEPMEESFRKFSQFCGQMDG